MSYCYCNKHNVSWDDSKTGQTDCLECLEERTGVRVASYLTDILRNAPFIPSHIPYKDIEEYVYTAVQTLTDTQECGDLLETSTGCTYTLTFKPGQRGMR